MDSTDYTTVPGQMFACLSIVGTDCPQRTDKFGIKIRGAFSTRDEAEKHAKRLQKEDATFDIYVVDMYKWLLIPPDMTILRMFITRMKNSTRFSQSTARIRGWLQHSSRSASAT